MQMKKLRTARFSFESERFLVISNKPSTEHLCPACAAEVRMVEIREASQIVGISQIEIFRLLETGAFHFDETPGGDLVICLASLVKALER